MRAVWLGVFGMRFVVLVVIVFIVASCCFWVLLLSDCVCIDLGVFEWLGA